MKLMSQEDILLFVAISEQANQPIPLSALMGSSGPLGFLVYLPHMRYLSR